MVVQNVLFGRGKSQGPRQSPRQPGQRDNGLVPGQPGVGAEPVVREDNGAFGVRRVPGGCTVRHHHHPGRAAEEKTVQARLVLHRVLRQRRFLL